MMPLSARSAPPLPLPLLVKGWLFLQLVMMVPSSAHARPPTSMVLLMADDAGSGDPGQRSRNRPRCHTHTRAPCTTHTHTTPSFIYHHLCHHLIFCHPVLARSAPISLPVHAMRTAGVAGGRALTPQIDAWARSPGTLRLRRMCQSFSFLLLLLLFLLFLLTFSVTSLPPF